MYYRYITHTYIYMYMEIVNVRKGERYGHFNFNILNDYIININYNRIEEGLQQGISGGC